MAKKSKSQIKRLIKRAEVRGEVYEPPVESKEVEEGETERKDETKSDDDDVVLSSDTGSEQGKVKVAAAIQLKKELAEIDKDEDMKAKERRSAKRKAEAIAVESSGFATAEELLEWHEANGKKQSNNNSNSDRNETKGTAQRKGNPYIVFIGQLSYDTTKESLFAHIQKELAPDHKVTEHNVKIRLLTDPKTKKSRGMAFVEVKGDPELLYSLLKLHHTALDDRRINVERSAGGGHEARKTKVKQYRQEQEGHVEITVNKILEEHYKRGEIQLGELDEGVKSLCKRHSAHVVEAALERYVESNGRDMDNPSAYFNFLIGKLATEGIYTDREKEGKKRGSSGADGSDRGRTHGHSNKRPRHESKSSSGSKKSSGSFKATSEFSKQGVDMSVSEGKGGNLASIFPSLSRGRGRGRGYM